MKWYQKGAQHAVITVMLHITFAIEPYILNGDWYFDDPRTGLHREPLTEGVPELLTPLCQGHPEGFRFHFSDTKIGKPLLTIVREGFYKGSTVYHEENTGYQCWLCPALLKYFTAAPETIWIWVLPKSVLGTVKSLANAIQEHVHISESTCSPIGLLENGIKITVMLL